MAADFKERLRRLREKAGLSQEGLSRQIGVATQTVCRWEWGHRMPKAEDLLKLSGVFGVSVDELLNGAAEDKWEWVISVDNPLKGEIDLSKGMAPVASVNASAEGAVITLGAKWDRMRDDAEFEELIESLRNVRMKVIQLCDTLEKGA